MKEYFFPDLTKKEVFEQGFIAEKSGHSRGSTIDLTLIYKQNGKKIGENIKNKFFFIYFYLFLSIFSSAPTAQPLTPNSR